MCENSRKRLPSQEITDRQSKYFVSNKIVNQSNEEIMKNIHKKTLEMLFNGAKKATSDLQSVDHVRMQLFGNGIIEINHEKMIPTLAAMKCISCDKMARMNSNCISCNMKLCENCGTTCLSCMKHLCLHCVTVFDCGTLDNPCCEQCKTFSINS